MVSRIAIVNAMAATLLAIPEVAAVLAPEDPVRAYIDTTPIAASLEDAINEMQPGQLLVVWIETVLLRGDMSKWMHTVEICIRSMHDHSDMELGDLIVAGVPVPGDGMVWRNCPLLPGLLPTEVIDIARRTDSEGVDYHVIVTETAETGDWPYP